MAQQRSLKTASPPELDEFALLVPQPRKKAGHDGPRVGASAAVRILVLLTLALCTAGIVVLGSASLVRAGALTGDSFHFLRRQSLWLIAGMAAAVGTALFPYRYWRRLAPPLGLVSVALLVLVLVVGREINGCRRWLELGPVNFQPSELAKFTTLLLLGYWYDRTPLRVGRFWRGLFVPGLFLGLVVGLVLMEPDFGATAMTAAAGGILIFVAGANLKALLPLGLVGVAGLFTYVRHNPRRWELIMAWIDPEAHPRLAFHYLEARKAFWFGGLWGVGYENSIEKHFYLPEVHTDFIFPVVAEELGLVGALAIVLLFIGFFAAGMIISARAPDFFGRLLAFGITLLITLQVAFNLCVVTGLLPTKGLALPFFSYGGSNLLITLVQCGILINIGVSAARHQAASAESLDTGRLVWDL